MKPHSPGSSHTSQTVPSRALSLVSLIAQYLNLGMCHSLVHGPVLKSVYTHPVCTPALPSLGPASSRCPSPWSWSYPSSYTAVIPWSIIISSTSSTLSAPPAPLSLSYFITLCKTSVQFSSVHSLSCVWFFATPWTAAHQASLSITNSWSFLRLVSIKLVTPSKHLILSCPFSSCL